MGINIWLPIIIDVLILGIMVAGALIGRKNGFLYELIKFVALCVCGVGLYFLNPIVANAVSHIGFVENAIAHNFITIEIIKAFTLLFMFLLVYLIATIILKIVKKVNQKKIVGVNTAKPAKIYGLNRKETRRLRREHKKLQKEQKKLARANESKKNKVFGLIFGLLVAIVVGFVITLPLKPIFNHIATIQPEIAEVEKGYEYTPYGELDKVTNIVEKILK